MDVAANGTSTTVEVVEVRPDRVQMKGALTFATATAAREAALAILNRSSSAEALDGGLQRRGCVR